MKITRWLAAAGILTLLILIVLTTVLVVPTMAFQGGQTVSAHTILARSGSEGSGLTPTPPKIPHGLGTPTAQPQRIKFNPGKCYRACMKSEPLNSTGGFCVASCY